MLVAHISDLHVMEPGGRACGVAETGPALARCVARINALSPPPDLVLVTGDVTNDGTAAQAQEAARLLDGLRAPFRLVPGNHDDRETLRAAFGEENRGGGGAGEFLQYAFDCCGVRFIALDTLKPGSPGGAFCPTRARWLREELRDAGDAPVMLFMHHPPLKFGVLETDADGFEGAALLGEIVQAHPRIERILCGHIHLSAHAAWRGAVVSTAPAATGMRLALDLTMREQPAFIPDDPAFLLHHRTADGGLATHCVPVRADETIHPFHPTAETAP